MGVDKVLKKSEDRSMGGSKQFPKYPQPAKDSPKKRVTQLGGL